MIHVSETLMVQTVEDFLTSEQISRLIKIMDSEAADWRPVLQTDAVPAPGAAQQILAEATYRALPAIRRGTPSIAGATPWSYTELTAGQSVPTRLDGITSPRTPPRRIGRIGVVIAAAEAGGRFYIETTSDPAPWTGAVLGEADGYLPGTPVSRSLPPTPYPHASQPTWLAGPRTSRWFTDAGAGVAVAHGAQVIHGVTPVIRGRLRTFVTDLVDTPPAD
ncbi:hypothetical protein [Streptomyces pinistramenti]|uniref:hypothetical protein n=1 Tax=Streptomyces pinistramenti TaxID=2884812 RepID=UPI001D087C1E|nr:hypothetical protein [Streptomyces pinistramenti]MCB5908416.1 hypothetical protein [Streptomyces pinistramenti]